MEKFKNAKKWIWIPILILVLLITIIAFTGKKPDASETVFNLNERDVVMEINESTKLELEWEDLDKDKIDVTWVSSDKTVATVEQDGTITAVAGGEAKITAIVVYQGKEYSTSCIVTVKSEDNGYSVYRIRWYTQNKDRNGYQVVEESFERLIGSQVELTVADAKKRTPSNYVFNQKKSVLTGKVKKSLSGCVLEVYFDVAEISYSVEYYYESATQLGSYIEKEAKQYKVYAFSKVEATETPKTGFVVNDKVPGTVKSIDSVVAGSKLKLYCDRARSKVTVSYVSGRASATYQCIYGIGLLNAPKDVFEDSVDLYKVETYLNGEKKQVTLETIKTNLKDAKVELKFGVGFGYSNKNGAITITNNSRTKATPSYAMLDGESDTLYLNATYKTTGSLSNTFGITLSSGGTSREIRFKNQGVIVMKDHTAETVVSYENAGVFANQRVYVWAQNNNPSTGGGVTTSRNSIVNKMLMNNNGGEYDISWAVSEGVLYCNIEGETVLRLPLELLEKSWGKDAKYKIGFSAYDSTGWGDALAIKNVKLACGKDADKLLVTEKFKGTSSKNVAYDAISGSYLAATAGGAAYLYGEETTENTGLSANVKWVSAKNTNSAVGVTLKLQNGSDEKEQTVQYVVQGQNTRARRHDDYEWSKQIDLTAQVNKQFTNPSTGPFDKNGATKIETFVKDGFFYIVYNGVQTQCVDLRLLFQDYTPESKVSIGIYSWDSKNGLAKFTDVKPLDKDAVANLVNNNSNIKEWKFYSESLGIDEFNFAEGTIAKTSKQQGRVQLFGSSKAFQVSGTMDRSADPSKNVLLFMGFEIKSGDKTIQIMGKENGFIKIINGDWSDTTMSKYINNRSQYAFNSIASSAFFNNNNQNRTQDVLGFKAIIYNDIFYVWFTDAEGNSGLCWRVPLTEKDFGSFKKGSEYELALFVASGSDATVSMTDLEYKWGEQVETKPEGASFETIEKNIANWAKWDDLGNMIVTGKSAEGITATAGTTSLYGEATTKPQVLKTTMTLKKVGSRNGITLLDADNGNSVQIVLEKNGFEENSTTFIRTTQNYGVEKGWSYLNDWTYNDQNVINKSTQEVQITAVVKDDILYLFYNDVLANSIDLYKLIPGYVEGHKIQLGLHAHSLVYGAVFSDVSIKAGEEALSNITLNDNYQTDIFYDNNGYMTQHTGINMKATISKLENGTTYTCKTPNGEASYIYSAPTTMSQVMNTTITLKKANSRNGITLKDATTGNSVQIVLEKNNLTNGTTFIRTTQNYGAKGWSYLNDWTYNDQNLISADAQVKVTAVVKDYTLYLFYNNVLANSIDLYKLIPGYVEGNAIQLGLFALNLMEGAIYSDISFKAGEKALRNITLNDNYECEIFYDNNGNMTQSAGTNMSAAISKLENGTTFTCTTNGKTGASYIYGAYTKAPQMLTTKIEVASDTSTSAHGITIQCGDKSVQFCRRYDRQLWRLKDYTWNTVTNVEPQEEIYTVAGGKRYYDLTAIVQNGTLQLVYKVNGNNVIYSYNLSDLFEGYTGEQAVRLGLFTWDANQGNATFSDVSFRAGTDVLTQTTKQIKALLLNKTNKKVGF